MPPINLGSLLPTEDKRRLAEEHLCKGSVFKFFCNRAKKEKIFILIGFRFDKIKIAFLHINTDINPKIFNTPALKNEHYTFNVNADRPFLSHDSFVNCSDLIIREKKEIFNLLMITPSIHLGVLCKSDLINIHNKVCNSKILRRDYKKEFGISFLINNI